jgi:hypothetical protein
MSRWAYEELLWHLLLRGADSLFLWCAEADTPKEIKPVHNVIAASRRFREFFSRGRPLVFEIPDDPGSVISCIQWERRLLVRRSDFLPDRSAVTLSLPEGNVQVPPATGECCILSLP